MLAVACGGTHPRHATRIELKEKDDAYLQFIRADLLSLEGEVRRSNAELIKLTQRYPQMAYFFALLAQNYGQEKRYAEAVKTAQKALELDPHLMEARITLGKLYALQEQHEDASREFAAAIRDDPKDEEIYPFLANEYVALGEYRRAIEVLRKLLTINPDSVIAYYYMGAINARHLNRLGEALRLYQEALSIDPANANVHNAVAEVYLRQQQLRKALAKYQEIAHLEPDEIAVWLRIALIHYELKEYPEAIAIFEQILDRNPEADKIRFYLGILYENTKERDKAIDELLLVPPKSSYFKEARLHVAALMREAGQIDEAIEELLDAIEQRERIPEFYEYLAAIFEENKRFAEAIDILERGHEALPDEEKIVFLLGIVYEKVEDRENAVRAMSEVLRINPQNASALNYIGYTYIEQGENLDEALEMIQEALILRPDDGYITDSLGWAYFQMGNVEQAFTYLTRANRLVPGEPTILDHLGEVLLHRGDVKGALRCFEQAIEAGKKKKDPDEKELERIREKIERLKGS